MYKRIRPLLFKSDAEVTHERVMSGLSWAGRHPGALRLLREAAGSPDPKLRTEVFGLDFPSPIGLAAGLDKNAAAILGLEALGFGFLEVGSVTLHPQAGNPKPRLFRLVEDEAIINRMGFNNQGAALIAARLKALRAASPWRVPVGINIGKSKITPLERAAEDYLASLHELWDLADYLAINVSSPNTPGLRDLQEIERMDQLLESIADFARERTPKPILVKVAPDLSDEGLLDILAVAKKHKLAGIIATNTTVRREGLKTPQGPEQAGGLSGQPLKDRSLVVLKLLAAQQSGLALISVGGVATADDVWERLEAGADLVQVYTSFIYEGPWLLKRLNSALAKRLAERELTSLKALHVR